MSSTRKNTMASTESSPTQKHHILSSKVLGLFKKSGSKDDEGRIFGASLPVAMEHAGATATLLRSNGEVTLRVPIIIAECATHLTEKGRHTEGIFRVSGSAERIAELQETFDSPDQYGRGINWAPYSVYDTADVLRRYLAQLPEPVIPHALYKVFMTPLKYAEQVAGDAALRDRKEASTVYRKLVHDLPAENRHLLIYLLNLLAFFASNADETKMGPQGMATVFQPGLLSRPVEEMTLEECKRCQKVVEFLIEMGDSFDLGDDVAVSKVDS